MILIDGTFMEALPMIITAIIGMIGISGSFIGYLFGPVKGWWRLILFASGFMLVIPGTATDIAGSLQIALVIILHRFVFSKEKVIN